MPLTEKDRQFLQIVDRIKVYLLLMALTVFVYLLLTPVEEIRMATTVVGVVLCLVFWLTQRLLSFVMLLDFELTRIVNVLKRSLPEAQRRELFRD